MTNATSDEEDSSSLEPGDLSSHGNEADIMPSTPDPTPEQTLSVDSDASPQPSTPPAIAMAARAYQREMLEESLKRNIIVAMETGSGKTQVAILRIQEELERSDKLVWFLAPTVELASQQFRVINSQIPGVQTKFIYGADCVETWTYKPKVWDAILTNIRIVVSTYQILFDAASHAFFPIESLGLVVIDEAHNCIRQNSIARFMRELYQPAKSEGRSVPHILGLTASPLMRSNLADLDVLEQTLDAVCKTPSRHRDELLSQVNRPEMIAQSYGDFPGPEDDPQSTPTMSRLKQTLVQLDIRQDPDVLRLKAERSERSREDLAKIMLTHDTSCQKQMRDFYNRAKGMCQVLGPWAADYYIHKVITEFLRGTTPSMAPQAIPDVSINEERKYLATAFLQVESLPAPEIPTDLSRKVLALISILESCEQTEPYGIVFVKERATVAVLLRILSTHPALRERYRVGSMVGTSKKQNIFDLGQKEDILSLQDFRHGKFNLLVGTSVLEEGIDVPVCNLVICFDKPDNLKSFIQRRGRARMSVSRLYLLVEDLSDQSLQEWQILEQEMKKKYEDDMRDIKQLEDMEGSQEIDYPILKDSSTGAQLTLHDAKKHLEHFCATLSTRKYVNWMPYYKIRDLEGKPIDSHQPGQRKAIVRLPISLAPELRSAESLFSWTSEADACRDAAFQAYVKLYKVGLINNHLLPIREMNVVKDAEQRPATIIVKEQLNPWPLVAQAWKSGVELSRRRLTLTNNDGSPPLPFEIALPVAVPHMEDFTLYMDTESAWVVSMDSDTPMLEADGAPDREADHTITLLKMAFEHRWPVENKQYPIRFVYRKGDISPDGISAKPFSLESVPGYLVRGTTGYSDHHPHIYLDLLPTKPAKELVKIWATDFDEAPQDTPYVVVKRWPKTAGYFHRPSQSPQQSSKPYPRVLPLNQVKVDSIPLVLGHVGMLIPSITSAVETYLVARDLRETLLESIGITDLALIVTAITATGAGRHVDYERVEFLGDTILKLCATINCTAKFRYYPESYLSASKDKVVCNSRLCRAAISLGLDRYIILKPATTHQWRPTYVEDLNANPPSVSGTRMMSSKTLADVVEALIGTSFVTGGLPRALACMSLFMPDFNWQDIDAGRQVLYDQAPADEVLPHTMRQLEDLVGYTFTKKALLVEAMTHPSYNALDVRASLDRLEFIGDAILDYIVVKKLFEHQDPQPLINSHLHIIHTALVNADILGLLVMEWGIKQERIDVDVKLPDATRNGASYRPQEAMVELVQSEVELPLWSFMRYSSPEMGAHQQATRSRYEKMRGELLHALHHGNAYPWVALARLQVNKFFSDVFESLLGAVWVDSGSMEECEKFVERAGILPLMRRFLKGGVHMPHPREELGVLAGMKTVRYEVEVLQGSNGGGTSSDSEKKESFGCKVFVDEECIADIIGGVTRDEVKSRAAEEACRFLKQRDPRNLPYAHARLGRPSLS